MKYEEIIEEFLILMKEQAENDYRKTQHGRADNMRLQNILDECLSFATEDKKIIMEDNLNEILSLDSNASDFLYARGMKDAFKIIKFFGELQ